LPAQQASPPARLDRFSWPVPEVVCVDLGVRVAGGRLCLGRILALGLRAASSSLAKQSPSRGGFDRLAREALGVRFIFDPDDRVGGVLRGGFARATASPAQQASPRVLDTWIGFVSNALGIRLGFG